ncbi:MULTISPECIES: TetR/AcrR family transcriptional regulator [Actinomadura]|uniref:TetR/AcrR family transcriptional regulator n=1 Tax=Actinomadura geliboluensis TaxID=882440 RepID=A0A5S4G8E0_9ACTN|nr:TetR/AcrR family transcriptional regulator [Actinomadura geliboluensis]TMR28814.1 TetR/AcrR family transcriptional regulator [Actinomadura geliboluensis]
MPTTRSADDRELSRVRILKAAAEIASECGYEGTTISRVTKRSGLPASSVYWFYRDKDHLMAEVIRHSFEQWIAAQPRWERDPRDERPLAESLRAILSRSVRSLRDAPDFLRIGHMLLLESREVEAEARRYFLATRDSVASSIAAWFTSYFDTELQARRPELAMDLARIVMAATDGLFLAHQIHDDWDPDDFVAITVAVVERAVAG